MKTWKKPAVATLKAKELTTHIRAAARTGICSKGFFR